MTAPYETTTAESIVVFRALPPREPESSATTQAIEDEAHRTMYRAAEIEARLRRQ
jgi:hypothetical protein